MLQINHNIKLIRELSGLKQAEFAKLIKTNLSNLKTYENTAVKPKANILAAIAEMAGVTIEDLEKKKLTHKDIKMKVDKDGYSTVPDVDQFLVSKMLKQDAMLETVLGVVAELLARQTGQPMASVLSQLERAVLEKEQRIKEELKKSE